MRYRFPDAERHIVDSLVAAGYRSALTVVAAARNQAMRLGFLSKRTNAFSERDVPPARHVADCVAVAVAHEHLAAVERVAARVRTLVDKGEALSTERRIVGQSDAWQRVLTRALRVAPTDTTVFLQGESGTGKEVVARFIHQASQRRMGRLSQSTVRRSRNNSSSRSYSGTSAVRFTGAHQTKAGQIELAANGVLFLDEVSEMSLLAQAKLLRFLQEREFQRLGGTRMQKANVRLIAATNRDLRQAVERGTFREDLFYRLQVFEIRLPSLRDRIDDVPLLADDFLADLADALGGPPVRLSDEARDALVSHDWPGNTRELRNVLESAAILSDEGVIERRHLPLHAKARLPASPHDLAALERQTIENALRQSDWNKTQAAQRLGLTRTQLYVRLRRYGVERSE
jgi:DNA-binding NtrC family response regulator